ncbi:MAG TPA: sugar-binding protein [Chthoniobacteraceae bacterium]|nr:sugar-binding protein [Chthoniobacteraceae bacterium]
MKRLPKFPLLALGLSALPWVPAAVAQTPVLNRVEAVPKIDGRIEPGEWKEAYELGRLHDDGKESPRAAAWMAFDDEHLYVAFRCEEPKPEAIRQRVLADEKDGAVWEDDHVEVALDPGNTGAAVFRLLANTEGTLYDAEGLPGEWYAAWESGARVEARKGETAWEVEMAIPMQSLRHRFSSGEEIALQLSRTRFASGERQVTSLSGSKPWPFEKFTRLLVEGPVRHGALSLQSPERGPFHPHRAGQWVFEVANRGEKEATLRFEFEGSGEQKEMKIDAHTSERVAIAMKAKAVSGMTQCRVSIDGEALFASRWKMAPVRTVEGSTLPIRNPLYEELLEPFPEGLSAEGFLLWKHDLLGWLDPTLFALRSGIAYSHEEIFAQYGRERAIVILYRKEITPEFLALARKHGVRLVIWPSMSPAFQEQGARKSHGIEKKGKRIRWIFDPKAEEEYLADLDRIITLAREYPEVVWGVYAGDETWSVALQAIEYFSQKGKEVYPWVAEVDEEIRTRTGFGKYGLPNGGEDDRLRWIATYRWMAARLIGLQKQARARLDASGTGLKLVSWDNMDGAFPAHLGEWGELFDVVTAQLYPARNADRERFGFGTMWLKDLTGAKEVWPLPHVEHYAANFTPEQTLDLLSHTFQGGATGLHLYLNDTIRRRAGSASFPSDRFGAPERQQVVTSVTERLKHPFRLKRAPADTAIFFSNPSYQAQGGRRPSSFEVEWIYQILGPRLQGAIRFVDEWQFAHRSDALAGLKVVYVPYAPVADDVEFEALAQFAENGGTLVLCDPHAFETRSDGSRRDLSAFYGDPALAQPFSKEDGKLRSIAKGKGRIIRFGQQPLVASVIADQEAIATFTRLQESAGALLGEKGWRFRFPMPKEKALPHPAGVCLSGNAICWRQSRPEPFAASQVKGSYCLSRPVSGEPAGKPIPFGEGKLTDRLAAALLPNDVSDVERFALKWKGDEPLEVTYRFERPVQVETLRLFYQGALPPGRCEFSADGSSWEEAERWEEGSPGSPEAVLAKTLKAASPSPVTYVRLRFEKRETGNAGDFILAETDLWGK